MSDEAKPKRKVSRLRYAISLVVLVIVLLVYAGFASGRIGNYEVISNSMLPTLRKGDRVLVDQRHNHVPADGDVIALEDPEDTRGFLTKRIGALSGQTVEISEGFLLVDGKEWAPPGASPVPVPPDRHVDALTLGEEQVFVLGDNVQNSEDSLAFGPVSTKSIKGKVLLIYWPPARMGRVR
jgi:signal peptidase I